MAFRNRLVKAVREQWQVIAASSIQQNIVRLRWIWFGAIGFLFLLAFNGEWRITTDSALYRELGRNLANGHGYVYLGQPHDHVYPGLPWLLAWSRQIFGQDLVPALILNVTLAIISLVLVYAMLKQSYPRWIAMATVMITGLSYQLSLYSATVLNDVPFFFAVCVALYAQVHIRGSRGKSAAGWIGLMLIGVGAAAILRPAFWLLVASLIMWTAWETFRGSKKLAAGMAIGLLVVGGVWALLDIREGGEYEAKLFRTLANPERIVQRASVNTPAFLTEHASDAFFGMSLGPGLDPVLAIIIFGGGVLLIRKQMMWGLLVLVTLLVTIFFAGTTPRYYLMVMPLLVLGWIQTLRVTANRVPRRWRSLTIGLGIALVVIPNVAMCVKLITRQQAEPFLETYRHGRWLPYIAMAEAIRNNVPDGEQTIGPRSSVLSYLSERDVLDIHETLRWVRPEAWQTHLSDQHVGYVVLPLRTYKNVFTAHREILLPLEETLTNDPTDESQWYLVRLRYDESEKINVVESIVATGTYGKNP